MFSLGSLNLSRLSEAQFQARLARAP